MALRLEKEHIKRFQSKILEFYMEHKRNFPWRETSDPYAIFVSEVMLQQTQAPRVVEKYVEFLKFFPDFRALAGAEFKEVLAHWKGLGYNRRALWLQEAAKVVMGEYGGVLPDGVEALDALPGIGPNTAGSIVAFAFNKPVVFIETNIRSVFIHEFFAGIDGVSDAEILELVEETIDGGFLGPREWYWALMDYGTHLKKTEKNPSRKSRGYKKQSTFEGSNRQLRGNILGLLLEGGLPGLSEETIAEKLNAKPEKVAFGLSQLEKEGLISKSGALYQIK